MFVIATQLLVDCITKNSGMHIAQGSSVISRM